MGKRKRDRVREKERERERERKSKTAELAHTGAGGTDLPWDLSASLLFVSKYLQLYNIPVTYPLNCY